ncbi:hypothetical protein KBY82_02445 [Cyanobium sp. AMD-g]|uniref:hypothetical protein n=1 Tax=Cyanobium sp. AMD-g TaxID=2823699 RepID=UPI0020CC336D|nr:hypothetical protein [Cyanobium sp. AMD-g]MCP9929639.1 hypothetical protein [Cyanobium sp. AMD-g]
MTSPIAAPVPVLGTVQPDGKTSASQAGAGESRAGQELFTEAVALLLAGVVAGAVVLVRRWLKLRSRPAMPGLPPERVLPFSRHGTIHDPKYLGRILEAEEPPGGP